MERRAASHTEEEEMNQRRKLLNAAKKGDQKAVGKLFELYQVRIFSGDQVQKLNKAAGLHKLQSKHASAGKDAGKVAGRTGKAVPVPRQAPGGKPHHKSAAKPARHEKKRKASPTKKNTVQPKRKKK